MFAVVKRSVCVSALVGLSVLSSLASAQTAVMVTAPVAPAAAPTPSPMTFKEWKAAKIQHSKTRVRALHAQFVEQKAVNPRSPRLPLIQQDLAQEHWNLEIAQDLTTRDYLYLYVKGQDVRPRLGEIAARLSPEEVNLFLESYFQLMERSQPVPSKRQRLGNQAQ